jgi:hypothetical protein
MMGWTGSNRSLTFQTQDLRISHAKIGAEIATYCLRNLEDTVEYFNDRRTTRNSLIGITQLKAKSETSRRTFITSGIKVFSVSFSHMIVYG